jgi:hypothetical protein
MVCEFDSGLITKSLIINMIHEFTGVGTCFALQVYRSKIAEQADCSGNGGADLYY